MQSKIKYYLVTTEWLYPTESGRDVVEFTYDTKEEAFAKCKKLCEEEVDNFREVCEATSPEITAWEDSCAYLAADDDGIEWWFGAKVIEVSYGRRC